jgi:hypothetical protein
MATGTLRPEKGPSAFFGPDIVYNNTCIITTLFFAGMSPTDVFLDNGQSPSSGNGELPGCDDALVMNGFAFGYCTDQADVDMMICFYEMHDNCTDIATATGTTCWYTFTGLPGTMTGVPLCWIITVDLMGTTIEWPFAADGDGVWDGAQPLDGFGYTYEILNVTGTATGTILAGEPIHLGQGCDFAVGTVYEPADPTGTSPLGTGYGSTDAFGLMNAGAYAGCFFFGGWPANPWSSYYMVMYEEDAGCTPGLGTIVCDGTLATQACPCGNNSGAGDQGCLHTGGIGGSLVGTDDSVANLGLTAFNLPAGNGGIMLTGTASTAPGVAVFDGITCTGGSTLRLGAGFETASGVRVYAGGTLSAEANGASPGYMAPGLTIYFVYWFRDVAAGASPCGTGANFTVTLCLTLS